MVGEVKIEPDFLNSSKLEYSKTVDINVNTNSPFGYKLLFSSDADDTALVSNDPKNTFSIPSVGGSDNKLSDDMHNQYGYNLEASDNKIYHYIPALSSPVQIKRVKTELTAADHVKFNLGFELESSAKPGEYHRNLIFTLLAEDQAAVELVNGIEINRAIKKAVGITDANYLNDPLNTTPEDPYSDLNITVGRNKCSSEITPERTAIISMPDSNAEVYLGGYRNSWDEICIWSNATELIFPEDLSYIYAGIGGMCDHPNFNFTDGRSKSTLNFKKVKNLDHLFHNSVVCQNGTFDPSNFFEYLKDSPIESAESLFENSAVRSVDKITNVVNHAKNLANAFRNTKSLPNINAYDWIISEAENTQSMFEGSGSSYIAINNATFAKTKNTANMFKDAGQDSSSILLPNAIFGETTDTHAMFMNTKSKSINLDKATFAKSTDASSMFEKINLTHFNLSSATFANTTNFSNFFKEAGDDYYRLTLELPKLSLVSAENLSQMFYKSNIENLNLNPVPMGGSHITNMSSMFEDCSYLTEIDLHNISTGPLETITHIFKNLPYVQKIVLPNVFNTASITDFSSMFENCTSLASIDNFEKLQLNSAINLSRMFFNTRMFYFDDIIPKLVANNVTDTSYMFSLANTHNPVVFPTTFNTSNITNMQGMFEECRSPMVDISNFLFNSVEDMSNIFAKEGVEDVKWPLHQNAPKLTTLSGAFKDNTNFQKVKAPKITAPALKDTSYMFSGMKQVTEFDIDDFDTSSVENMSHMFSNNRDYFMPKETVVHFNLDTSSVKDLSYFLYHARTWHPVVNTFNTRNVTNMASTFEEVWASPELDLTGWDTSKVTDMTRLFYDSSYIEKIYVSDTFVTTNVTQSDGIFGGYLGIIGQQGTSASGHDISYARIDEPGKPGAFTRKP